MNDIKTNTRGYEQVIVEAVSPSVDGGRHPVKRIVGETVVVEAAVFRHGHDRVRAALRWKAPGATTYHEVPMALANPGLDLWHGEIALDKPGRYRFTVIGWTDAYASWVDEFAKRVRAKQPDLASEMAEGLTLMQRIVDRVDADDHQRVAVLLDSLRAHEGNPAQLLKVASSNEALTLLAEVAPRDDEEVFAPELAIIADRPRAQVGAWYELFIRSQATESGRSGTFRDAERRLPDIHDMGFNVIYLAPIHPIGRTNRKGKNNSLRAGPDDPGSPWAIGSEHGGHKAIEPALGTLDDFDRFVQAAAKLDMEIALDFAIQCSPDHPWAHEHPDWFYRRPDGTIRYAENPPKKYEDIYPLNFDSPDWKNLWEALRDVVRFWIGHGVKIFRVDNPHTKPIGFWTWLIESIQEEHPDVIFLAEAFTRPPMMQALAKRGFTQSYTYFTWRNSKKELVEYLTELTQTDMVEYFRPNFFANTPDILPPILQLGGRPAFKMRAILAATLATTYGIYSGFELCENDPIPGREEYINSEKYEIKPRDWGSGVNIKEFIALVNAARRQNPALRQFKNLTFLDIGSDHFLAYAKTTDDGSNAVIVVVNLDPFAAHEAMVDVPFEAIGLESDERYHVTDLLTGARYEWGARNYVRLDPIWGQPAHLLRVDEVL